ncbi:MAG: hypothetical protein GEU79_12700 [Acidimicrobiia bacterium]|nr:hypothetical protein [Acidimicrobiia bacterium]
MKHISLWELAKPPEPELLSGDGTQWEGIVAMVEARGYTVETTRRRTGEANGQTDSTARKVTVRSDLEGAQRTKTLVHELAHVILHADAPRRDLERSVLEVEAESVAYLVCQALGIDSARYSVPYVAAWAHGDLDLISQTARQVVATANTIQDTLF